MVTIEQAIANLQQLIKDLPTIVGNEMVNDALDHIKKETDIDGKPMVKRKAGTKRNKGRSLLVDKGDGRRSLSYQVTGYIIKFTGKDYMIAHNEGVNKTVSVSAHRRAQFRNVRVGTGTYNIKSRTERKRTERVASTTRGTVRAHTRKMDLPQREFAGKNKKLTDRINKIISNRTIKAAS